MREDMESVTARLAQAKVGEITQGIEQDIIKSLEEMVAALQRAQREQQQQRRNGQQPGMKKGAPGAGQQQDRPLVNAIAELKMIRALQMRVNTRTKRYSELLREGTEQADQPDLVEALQRLGEREDRVHKTTHDIEIGKNR
jgi:ribosomal protein L19E